MSAEASAIKKILIYIFRFTGISVKGKTSTITTQKQGNQETSIDMGIFINSVLHGGAASR